MEFSHTGLIGRILLGALAGVLPFAGVDAVARETRAVRAERARMSAVLGRVGRDMPHLVLDRDPAPHGADTAAYFAYYGLDAGDVPHWFGWSIAGGQRLAVHVYRPADAVGTVTLVHGYYDHAGIWRHLIPFLLARGYAVVAFDLPGHGLSSGERAIIDHFSDYVTCLHGLLTSLWDGVPAPLHIVAHSMGAGITSDYFLSVDRPVPAERVILLAPLVRHRHWHAARTGQALAALFGKSVRRVFRKNSSDEGFLRFVRQDPLQCRRVPLSFCRAVNRWAAGMADRAPRARPVVLIQGTADTTVDWAYNSALLTEKLVEVDTRLVEGAGHQLHNEAASLREAVFALIAEGLR